MPDAQLQHEAPSLHDAGRNAVSAALGLQHALEWFAARVDGSQPQIGSADALEGMWTKVRGRQERLEQRLAELAEAVEDALDVADAQAALDELGASIPWDQVKAELGLS